MNIANINPVLYHGKPIVGRMPPFKDFLRAKVRKGEKTVTRRVISPQPEDGDYNAASEPWRGEDGKWRWMHGKVCREETARSCRYGMPGDVRCMIEPLVKGPSGYAQYKDDGATVFSLITRAPIPWQWSKDVLTSIHMPTEAARTVVEYSDIRAERLHDITDEDALAEGAEATACLYPSENFEYLWDSINAKRGHAWELNEWVWRIAWVPISPLGTLREDVLPEADIGRAREALIRLGAIPATGQKGYLFRMRNGQPVPITRIDEIS